MTNKTSEHTVNLSRFIDAQKATYITALSELALGKKKTHWMWYIFPQLIGLGYSKIAIYYAIKNEEEAREYLKHSILGQRLRECTEAILSLKKTSALEVFGYPDNLKLKLSMTLFLYVSEEDIYSQVLDKFFDGEQDVNTIKILDRTILETKEENLLKS